MEEYERLASDVSSQWLNASDDFKYQVDFS